MNRIIDRDRVYRTGEIPDGAKLFQDDIPWRVLDMKKGIIKEEVNGKSVSRPVMRVTGVFQKAEEKNANGRIYPLSVLKEAVGSIQKPISERRVLGELDHPCLILSTLCNTRILTTNGWKNYQDIKIGDFVYSRVNGQMIPSRVNAIINEDYNGPAYIFKGRHMNIGLTAPHKMILDSRSDRGYVAEQIEVTADEFYKNRKKYNKHKIPRTAEWDGTNPEAIIIPGIPIHPNSSQCDPRYLPETDDMQIPTDVFVQFLGLYLAEGCLHKYLIEICQQKDDYKDQIREMLTKVIPGKEWIENDRGFHISDRRLSTYLQKLGRQPDRYIPEDIKQLDGKFLEELVYWYQLGDGRMKHGRSNVFSVSERLINDLHECWVKAGHCCYRTIIVTEDDYEFAGRIIKAENKRPLHQLTLSHTTGIYCDDRFLQIEPMKYDGKIWCLTTEHGNFYVENDGCSFWTGNCDAKIHMDRVCHLITKLWLEGNSVYGESEILNDDRMPCGSMLACLLDRKVPVGVSSRGVGDMDIKSEGGEEAYLVQPGYQIVTFDAVADPSVTSAQMKIMESRQRFSTNKMKPLYEIALIDELMRVIRQK